VIAARDQAGAARAAKRLAEETGNPEVEAMRLDLASLSSVRGFAEEFAAREDLPPLRAVINNAGLQVVNGTTYTEDGFETTFGVNHLGHFLLVNLLLREMSAPARVVYVSSGTHDPKQRTGTPEPRYRSLIELVHPDEYPDPAEEDESLSTVGRRRYTTSKLLNIYATYELDRRLRAEGLSTTAAPITVNAFDPGLMPGTGLARDYSPGARFVWNRILPRLLPLFGLFGVNINSVESSGRNLARLVLDPKLEGVSGRYFEGEKEIRSSELSYDRANAAELWETSAELANLRTEETPLRPASHASGT
jgi:NAD(P)-dependent dehydrogenase (short-subunit alcohol dehydrogenase family)